MLLLACACSQADSGNPLEPVDTASPRATLNSLLSDVDAVWRVYRDEAWHSPSKELTARIFLIAGRALRTLDLSQVAPSARIEVGYDSATFLYETLSRIELPPFFCTWRSISIAHFIMQCFSCTPPVQLQGRTSPPRPPPSLASRYSIIPTVPTLLVP